MALLAYDGFEGIAIGDISLRGWTLAYNNATGGLGSASIVAGLNGNALRLRNGLFIGGFGATRAYRTIPNRDTIVIGAAFNKRAFTNANDHLIFSLWEGGTCHVSATVNNVGTFKIYRDRLGAVLGESASAIYSANNWVYLELEVFINDTTGYARLYREGVEIISVSGVDTRNGATGVINQIALDNGVNNPGTSGQDSDYDDCYWLDNGGTAPANAPLGPVRVDRLLPNSDGATTDFTPSSGAVRHHMVDESLPDGDTTYNESGVSGHRDIVGLSDLPTASGTIFAVTSRVRARRTDADTIQLIPSIISNTVEEDGTARTLSSSYEEYSDMFPLNPDGDVAWSDSAVNALQAAYRNA